MNGMGLLSLLVFLPVLGALPLAFFKESMAPVIKAWTLAVTFGAFALSVVLLLSFKSETFHFQFVEFAQWVPQLGVNYKVGVDGISIWLVVLTTFLTFISAWFSGYVQHRVKHYMVFLLLLETAMLGVFVSLDMILFYTFFELSLIPMYFIIAIWGGERRGYASIKFFLYTFAGSIFMLAAIIGLYVIRNRDVGGPPTFDLIAMQHSVATGALWAKTLPLQALFFWAFAIGFLIKCPAFPFHTWLPDAHVEAPTAGSVILAGVLLKMGTYGFLRFCLPLFPDVAPKMAPIIVTLAVIGIIYGAIVAAVQPDLKKLIAYSSVAHMGFVLVGIFSFTHNGLMGGSLQQLNHGVSTGALFLLVGLIYERRHTRMFREFGGLKARMPIYSAIFLIVMLSSVGLPGTNGFIGEFLAMLGLFESSVLGLYGLNVAFPVIAGFGVVLAAVYLLTMFMRTFYGPLENPENQRLRDIKPWEIAMAGSLVVLIFWGGLYPNTFLKPMEKSIAAARLMALAGPGQRPSWAVPVLEIDDGMNLVVVNRAPSEVGRKAVAAGEGRLVTPGRLRYEWTAPSAVATRKEEPSH